MKIKHKSNYNRVFVQPITFTKNMQYPQQVWFTFIHIANILSFLLCTNSRCKTKEMKDVYYMPQWVLLCNTSSSQDPVAPVPSAMICNNSLCEVTEARKLLKISLCQAVLHQQFPWFLCSISLTNVGFRFSKQGPG